MGQKRQEELVMSLKSKWAEVEASMGKVKNPFLAGIFNSAILPQLKLIPEAASGQVKDAVKEIVANLCRIFEIDPAELAPMVQAPPPAEGDKRA